MSHKEGKIDWSDTLCKRHSYTPKKPISRLIKKNGTNYCDIYC